MSKVTIAIEVDADALRSMLRDAEVQRDEADERMNAGPDRHDYTDEDRAAHRAAMERDEALTATLTIALDRAVAEALEMALPLDDECPSGYGHDWQMTEDGYSRSWGTEIDHDSKAIAATYSGAEDWSEEGDGEYLTCDMCGAHRAVPDGYEIVWG